MWIVLLANVLGGTVQGGSVGVHCCRHAAWQLGAEEVKTPKPSAGNLLWVCWASAVISGAMTTMCMAC